MRAYLFDIDGTLADNGHRFHHIADKSAPNWAAYFAACGDDKPIERVIELAAALYDRGHEIVLVSGRSDVCQEATEEWLIEHCVPYHAIYMRKEGDHRDDDKLKIEMLAQIRADGYEVIMAFDDRNRVVKAWREAGVPCAQVAEGDF